MHQIAAARGKYFIAGPRSFQKKKLPALSKSNIHEAEAGVWQWY